MEAPGLIRKYQARIEMTDSVNTPLTYYGAGRFTTVKSLIVRSTAKFPGTHIFVFQWRLALATEIAQETAFAIFREQCFKTFYVRNLRIFVIS
jgi:hypothetical protein